MPAHDAPADASEDIRSVARRVRATLPHGQTLPPSEWARRHRVLTALLWLHAIALPLYGISQGHDTGHTLAAGGGLALLAALARLGESRKRRSALVSIGLLSASALLVHFSGGVIETHFHFFVVVLLLTLYEDWTPFLIAVGYVALHHGAAGMIAPSSVYNHADAIEHPWKWAGIHALFIAAAGLAGIATWRLNEQVRDRLRTIEDRYRTVVERLPAVTYVAELGPKGRWTFVSPQIERLLGYTEEEWRDDPGLWLSRLHPEDRERVVAEEAQSGATAEPLASEYRMITRSGEVVWVRDEAKLRTGGDEPWGTVDGLLTDITERKGLEEKLRHLATYDQMTGLLNRHRFDEELERELARSRRQGTGGALLVLDLDHFKAVNDSMGHHAGDELLKAVAAGLRNRFRATDLLGRLGGDEFAMLLPDADLATAERLGRQIIEELREHVVLSPAGPIRTTASVGIAILDPSAGLDAEALLARADASMYRAKKEGGDRLAVFAREEFESVG